MKEKSSWETAHLYSISGSVASEHSNTTEDVKARLVFIYAVRGLKIYWSAFALLTGLSEQVISRHGRTVTL